MRIEVSPDALLKFKENAVEGVNPGPERRDIFYCNKKGHIMRNCHARKKKEAARYASLREQSGRASIEPGEIWYNMLFWVGVSRCTIVKRSHGKISTEENDIIIDTWASGHVVQNPNLLTDVK